MLSRGLALSLTALPPGGLHLHPQTQGQSRGQETRPLETLVLMKEHTAGPTLPYFLSDIHFCLSALLSSFSPSILLSHFRHVIVPLVTLSRMKREEILRFGSWTLSYEIPELAQKRKRRNGNPWDCGWCQKRRFYLFIYLFWTNSPQTEREIPLFADQQGEK